MPQENQAIELTAKKDENHLVISPRPAEPVVVTPKPAYISLGLPQTAFRKEVGGASARRKLCDTAVPCKDHEGCLLLFSGAECYEFNYVNGNVTGPWALSKPWGAWPGAFSPGINAAVWGGNVSYPHLYYFFRDNLFARYDRNTGAFDYGPVAIEKAWNKWVAEGLDFALHAVETKYLDTLHLFRRGEYVRHNLNTGGLDAGPCPITEQYKLPPDFASSLDLAFYGSGKDSQKIWFLREDQFIVYDIRENAVVDGPRAITSRWPALARFFSRPQIFLVEEYELASHRTGLVLGDLKHSESIGPGSTKEFTLVMRRSTTQSITETSTVLDSRDDALVDNLSTTMKEESKNSTDTDKYDYNVDASFSGEANWSPGSADWQANFNLKGSTNDVRKHFAESAASAVDKQVSRTSHAKKESVRAAASGYTAQDQSESIQKQTISNPTTRSINSLLYQLKEAVLTLVVLKDVQVAFANGQECQVVPLPKLDDLLKKYTEDSKIPKIVRNGIVEELKRVVDYQGREHSVLRDEQAERLQFNSDLKSTFITKAGTPIEVSGLITDHIESVQLTNAVVLVEAQIG